MYFQSIRHNLLWMLVHIISLHAYTHVLVGLTRVTCKVIDAYFFKMVEICKQRKSHVLMKASLVNGFPGVVA